MVHCAECKVNFSKTSNLRAHVNRKHPEKIDVLAPKVKGEHGTFVCEECRATFVKLGSLRTHIQQKHAEKFQELVPAKKKFHCKQCNEEFDMLKKLIMHRRSQHAVINKELKCPLCPFTGPTSKHLISHYQTGHSLTVASETLFFQTFEEFQVWKMATERQTFSSFVNMHGFKKGVNCKKIKYTCHRSGNIRTRGQHIRSLKTRGSNKINGYCPAEMCVTLEDTKCAVQFCNTHVGHKLKEDMGHLFLSTSDRQHIASKIAAKIPLQSILDEVRDSVTNSKLERTHLLTKKDLYNIERAFNLNRSAIRHANDAISVDAWVNELKVSGSILFYKPQGCLSNEYPQLKQEDFVLMIMTEGQKELLLRFGDDCICMDGTHGLNGYGFELHTILVLDDLREGYPSAFLISSRNDAELMKIFFLHVEEQIGKKIKPRVFMSDMAEAYYNAWLQVMHPAEFRLYCSWHVDRAWRKNLEKVVNKEKKILIYQMLRMLLQERDIETFNTLTQKFLEFCQGSPESVEFANYFQQHYVNKAEHWAYCFRLYSGLNTNMHIERMHRTIKHLYLNGKYVKRLDKAISAILKFVRDKIFERLIVVHKGKVCTKLSELRQRHKTSEMLDISKVEAIDDGWLVPSASRNEMYVVQEIQSECTCKLECSECGVCIHRYACTCVDCSIKWNMCKHVHLVCKFIQQNSTSICKEVLSDNMISDVNEVDKAEETANLVMALSTKKKESQIVFEEQKKLVQTIQELIFNTQTLEEIEAIKTIVAPIQPTLEAIRNNQAQRKSFPLPMIAPSNKNIEPQRRLFKTKKAPKTKKTLSVPSVDEMDTLARQLIHPN
uniref:Uncharacterized protein LOC114341342 n=1 Tax=Diabrotica virgifera virgifera TaxID=50390 RepID=A0A6P7GVN3_DIAVI